MNFYDIWATICKRCLFLLCLLISTLQNLLSNDSPKTKIINQFKIILSFFDVLVLSPIRCLFKEPENEKSEVTRLSSKEISEFTNRLDETEVNDSNRDEFVLLKRKLSNKI